MTSSDAGTRARIRAALVQHPGEAVPFVEILTALGIRADDRRGKAMAAQALSRMRNAGEIERPEGLRGYYRLRNVPTLAEANRSLRSRPIEVHDIGCHATAHAVLASEAGVGGSGRIWSLPPSARGAAAGNKREWRWRLGADRQLTIQRHANGADAFFGVTDRPLRADEFAMAADVLEMLTGIPVDVWEVRKIGLNKDGAAWTLQGFGEARVSLGDAAKEVLRAYVHGGRGVRMEAHLRAPIGLREVLAILGAEGHLSCMPRFQRVEEVLKQLAGEVGRLAEEA